MTIATQVLSRRFQDLPILKVGRTTGLTRGRLLAHSFEHVKVDYDDDLFRSSVCFSDFYTIVPEGDEPFAEEGDSGSLVTRFDGERYEALGIPFLAGVEGGASMVAPIRKVRSALDATLASGHYVALPASAGRRRMLTG